MTAEDAATGSRNNGAFVPASGSSITRSMQEIVPYGVLTTDRELRITSWNRWLALHSGKLPAEVLGRPLAALYSEVDDRKLRGFRSALAGEISVLSTALHHYLLPLPTLHEEAGEFMLQTAWIAPLQEGGTTVGTIAIIEDVTQRELQTTVLHRQQELDRLLSEALGALLRSSDPAQDLPNIFPLLMPSLGLDVYLTYLLTPDHATLHLSTAGGLTPAQREPLTNLALDAEDQAPAGGTHPLTRTLQRHHATLQALRLRFRLSIPLVVSDRLIGLVTFASYHRDVIAPADHQVLSRVAQYAAIALDRSIREREIVAASRAKDDFLAALSHELRTPLNPVLLLASDSAANPAYSTEARDAFRMIEKNALLEARLIDDLLDLTRIERGKMNLDVQLVDLHAALLDAIVTIRAEADAQGLKVATALQAEESVVHGDAARLQQVFWNLFKNAIRFTPPGGTIEVRSRINASAQTIEVLVSDSGIGIRSEDLQRIFGAFVQAQQPTRALHRFGGLGLGLAITQQLVELHGGQIEAASPGVNEGSTFTVTLPLAKPLAASTASSPTAAAAETGRPARRGQAGRCILLVEDHEPTRLPLTRLLTRRGYDVIAVGTVQEALDAASSRHIDLVLSDVGLPDGDGLSLMKQLRDQHQLRGIALTGYGMDEDLGRSRGAGYVAHLTKPISISALERALAQAFA